MEKIKESLQAVLPVGLIIIFLHFTVAPMPVGTLILMLGGMVMLIVGLVLFTMGTEMAMMPIGEHIGSALISSRKLPLIVVTLLVFGFIATAAEPDLQILANQVASIPKWPLIFGIAAGVGIFLAVSALRILFKWKLSTMLIMFYILIFVLAIFSSDYLAVSFDAAAVTTGPVTVPFLLAIGAGFASINSGKDAEEDNFGICAICSVGPILGVLILGFFFNAENTHYLSDHDVIISGAAELVHQFALGLWYTLGEVFLVIIPILGTFLIFQITKLRLSKTELVKIFVGLMYLLIGLTIFLTGVNEGFMPAAKYLGEAMGSLDYNWILIPLCVIIGACVVLAEPAVHVLTKQVEEITSGAVTRTMMLFGMGLGVGLAMSLAMVRMLFDISIWYILVPGYLIALALSRFVPNVFVGIGFDSGGVAAGAMSAAFVLPFTIGVCTALGGNVITDAFGVVGMIAMMPPIIVQIMGFIYKLKLRKSARLEALSIEKERSLKNFVRRRGK